MYDFIRVAIGEFDWSSVILQVGQTISASRSACFGGAAPRATANASATSQHGRGARVTPPCEREPTPSAYAALLRSVSIAALDALADESARRSTKNVSGNPVTPHWPIVEPECRRRSDT